MPMLATPAAFTRPDVGIHYFMRQNDPAQTSAEGRGSMSHTPRETSTFWENKALFDEVRGRLGRTARLQPGWDTYDGDPPNQTARALAAKVLTVLEAEALPPLRLLPSVEGGIAISFAEGETRAEIEIYNTGEIAAAAYSGQGEPTAWEFDGSDSGIRTAIEQIRVRLSR
jgi:hypothetical protein